MRLLLSTLVVSVWVLIPVFIILGCVFSFPFLILYFCFWVVAQIHFYRVRHELKKQGILSSFDLYREHGKNASEFIETLNEPKFINPSELPYQKVVVDNYDLIRKEILEYVNTQGDVFSAAYNNKIMETTKAWKARSIFGWGLQTNSDFPITENVMRQIGAVTCNVSRLSPETAIKAHNGETNAFTRCHLPLVVPAPLPDAGMVVGGEERSWVEGEILAFIDLNFHRAFNNTSQDRIVLIFDVMRPGLEEYRSTCCTKWLLIYTFTVFDESLIALSINNMLAKPWRSIFDWVAKPPVSLGLWVYYRWFCRKLPFWFRIHKNTGFYF